MRPEDPRRLRALRAAAAAATARRLGVAAVRRDRRFGAGSALVRSLVVVHERRPSPCADLLTRDRDAASSPIGGSAGRRRPRIDGSAQVGATIAVEHAVRDEPLRRAALRVAREQRDRAARRLVLDPERVLRHDEHPGDPVHVGPAVRHHEVDLVAGAQLVGVRGTGASAWCGGRRRRRCPSHRAPRCRASGRHRARTRPGRHLRRSAGRAGSPGSRCDRAASADARPTGCSASGAGTGRCVPAGSIVAGSDVGQRAIASTACVRLRSRQRRGVDRGATRRAASDARDRRGRRGRATRPTTRVAHGRAGPLAHRRRRPAPRARRRATSTGTRARLCRESSSFLHRPLGLHL